MSTARLRRFFAAAAAFAAAPALADAPRVVVDIAPVHSIAAAVMAGVGAPELILPPGASPHGHVLRPSEAAAVEAADLVVWVGPGLTPWLADPLAALAEDTPRLTLEDAAGVRRLPARGGGPFDAHVHDGEADAHEDHDDHAHGGDAHADHAHGDDHGHDGAHAEHAEHAHAAHDPHLWLDPRNGAAIAAALAAALAEADPANAEAYADNAAAFAEAMAALEAEVAAELAPVRGRRYIVFHDAYQYFEDRFAAPAAGSVALGDADALGAGRVAALRARFADEAIDCVFAEPQFEPKLIATLIEGADTRTGSLDPLGAALEPGPGLYPALLRGLAADLRACLDPES